MPEWWGEIPWGVVSSIAAFMAGIGFRALKQTLGENFISNKTFDDKLGGVAKEISGIADSLKEASGSFQKAVKDFDARMDRADTEFRAAMKSQEREIFAHLEKHYATIGMLDGFGTRLTETDRRVSGAVDTFARAQDQILDKANQAESLSRATDAKVERFVAVMEERLKPLDELRRKIEGVETKVGEILAEVRRGNGRRAEVER
jgi:methyl-accepting chemotaxis protein